MIRNYVRKFEGVHSFEDIDDENVEIELRQPSKEVFEKLFDAIRHNNLDAVKRYINLGYDVNALYKDDRTGLMYTPLIKSCYYNNYDIAKILLKNGADVNEQDENGYCALSEAISEYCDLKLVKLLLENGADVNLKDFDDTTPLMYAAMNANIDAIKLLLNSGASLNFKDFQNKTALDHAEQRLHLGKRFEIAKDLLLKHSLHCLESE